MIRNLFGQWQWRHFGQSKRNLRDIQDYSLLYLCPREPLRPGVATACGEMPDGTIAAYLSGAPIAYRPVFLVFMRIVDNPNGEIQ
jgi:hypothetical protein